MKRFPLMLLVVILAACGSTRRGEPIVGPMRVDSQEIGDGQILFMKHCQQCHPGGEAGLGPSLTDKPLPNFLMRLQVRHGFGAMPAFSEDDISRTDLDDLLAYLKELRRHG